MKWHNKHILNIASLAITLLVTANCEQTKTPDSNEATHTSQAIIQTNSSPQRGAITDRFGHPLAVTNSTTNQRHYPQKSTAAHIIGHISHNQLNNQINTTHPKSEGTIEGKIEGKSGLEKAFNHLLTPKHGNNNYQGATITTTLDLAWQQRAEGVLKHYCKRGAFVVIDVETGEILVLASRPSYDLNLWVPKMKQENYDKLLKDPSKPMFARAFQAAYPPASVFTTISKFAQSNPDPQAFITIARKMGYGIPTGLPLHHENPGLLLSNKYTQKIYNHDIREGDIDNAAIGQGTTLATPLQVAQSMAIIVNKGKRIKLHLIKQIQTPDGTISKQAKTETLETIHLDQQALQEIKHAMHTEVNTENTTAQNATLNYTSVCGKASTAQWGSYDKKIQLGWFAGFLPSDKPKYAFAIIHEGTHNEKVMGEKHATKIFRAFFNALETQISSRHQK